MSAHKYELMFIADPELDERGLKKLTEQYLETVTKEGGAVENIEFPVRHAPGAPASRTPEMIHRNTAESSVKYRHGSDKDDPPDPPA